MADQNPAIPTSGLRCSDQKNRIISIIFSDISTGPEDRVIMKDGNQLFRKILDTAIQFDDEALGGLTIRTADVLAAQFTF